MSINQLLLWPLLEFSTGAGKMEFATLTKPRNQIFISRFVARLALLVITAGCEPTTPEPIDAAHIAGRWELATTGETEWFDISPGGDFSATIRSNSFIATTLSQGERARLAGRWELTGNTLTFHIEKSSDEVLVGQEHRYEIESLTSGTMATVDAAGRQQTLRKAL